MADDITPKPGKGSRVLDGLRDAVAGNFAAVTIEGETWVKQGHEDEALDRARSRIAALEEALKPFAEAADTVEAVFTPSQLKRVGGDNLMTGYWPMTLGALRSARSVLNNTQNAPTASHSGEDAVEPQGER